jgi:hypothetical protein
MRAAAERRNHAYAPLPSGAAAIAERIVEASGRSVLFLQRRGGYPEART